MVRAGACAILLCALAAWPAPASGEEDAGSPFDQALRAGEAALGKAELAEARRWIDRALERDARSAAAWDLRTRWAEAAEELDEQIYSLHRRLEILTAQDAPAADLRALRARVLELDPLAKRTFELAGDFTADLLDLAEKYEQEGRPHSAIQVYRKLTALNPDRTEFGDAIARISARPDPSLADTARAHDVMADVSVEWVREFDAQHTTWDDAAVLEGGFYVTRTDAGYEVLRRTSEAMEQMNAFYRLFFGFGNGRDKDRVPRIEVRVFREKETYLAKGKGPPKEWSGGQFAGDAVETYIGRSSFERMTRTLFHEAAHQFVSLTSGARGWLNEGLASYFEGCRILANGTVLMNLPAEHRLFPLADRMAAGWMSGPADGIDPGNPRSKPRKAPRIRAMIESDYEWGPAWYAPTWGLVYFLHNCQDPADGRFVYRDAFWEFVNSGGPWTGSAAVSAFEKTVLKNPSRPTKGVDAAQENLRTLPRDLEALDERWREWILALRDEQRGLAKVERPWLEWARHAITRGRFDRATELFEKGLVEDPENCELLSEFAAHLEEREKNPDRAAKLVRAAMRLLESGPEPDMRCVRRLERRLEQYDSHYRSLRRLEERLVRAAHVIVEKYLEAGRDLMTMHTCSRLAGELNLPELMETYREAVLRSGKTLAIWQLAYNETDFEGWATTSSTVFSPRSETLAAKFGKYVPRRYSYTFLTLDRVTSGDFSMEAEVRAESGKNAFCGLVFGRRGLTDFHTLIYFPEGNVDLASFMGAGKFKTWRSDKLPEAGKDWRTLRIDVVGRLVDVWADRQYVFSQSFDSLDLLRGSFGLITGVGECSFRNVRFLAREPRDPSARMERNVRMERRARTGEAVAGSYLGQVPPRPVVSEWVQDAPEGWGEPGLSPTVLLLFSIEQNELIPLHVWMDHLRKKYAEVGLEFVSVCEAGDGPALRDYLAGHPFPGAVGVDLRDEDKDDCGRTLDAYFIGARYNFPRMLLLDIDGRVAWEGNPGFALNDPWIPGTDSQLDRPLEDLVLRRGLRRLSGWLADWKRQGEAALERGDLESVAELLRTSTGLPGDVMPEVARAQTVRRRVTGELEALEECIAAVVEDHREPALEALLAWAKALGAEIEPASRAAVGKHLRASSVKAFATVRKRAARLATVLESRPDNSAAVEAFLKRIAPQPGGFVADVVTELRSALERGDPDRVVELVGQIEDWPARWLAREYFGF